MSSLAQSHYRAALAAVERAEVPPGLQADMLVEIAMGLQSKPRAPGDFALAVELYQRALALAADEPPPTQARIRARQATALSLDPAGDVAAWQRARALLEAALPELAAHGGAEEVAEAEMNLGLILQSLAGEGAAAMPQAIAAYQRALQTFTAARHPREFAILHNNLATAYLAMAGEPASERVREALAVQAFETALAQIDRRAHPREYAMLQNNLGNALQYAASGHALENNLRALAAYEEALSLRDARSAPVEYANTMANLGNCLANLPAAAVAFDPAARARECLRTAARIFRAHGQPDKAALVTATLTELGDDGL